MWTRVPLRWLGRILQGLKGSREKQLQFRAGSSQLIHAGFMFTPALGHGHYCACQRTCVGESVWWAGPHTPLAFLAAHPSSYSRSFAWLTLSFSIFIPVLSQVARWYRARPAPSCRLSVKVFGHELSFLDCGPLGDHRRRWSLHLAELAMTFLKVLPVQPLSLTPLP